LAEDEVMPVCIDPLRKDSEFILDITERATAFLNFYMLAVKRCERLEGNKLWAVEEKKKEFKDKYFDPLFKTIEAGFSTLQEQEESAEKQPEVM